MAAPAARAASIERSLPPDQAARLHAWYGAVGSVQTRESFGSFVVRVAKRQLGVPYDNSPEPPRPEELRIRLDTQQCVSLVESSLAVARCVWQQAATESCFMDEVQAMRYRGGVIDGYASRLHYFVEWIDDNVQRRRFELLTPRLGAVPIRAKLDYITRHAAAYPTLADASIHGAIAAVEQRLSAGEYSFVPRERIAEAQRELQDGDVIALVGSKPGLIVTHAGFIARGAGGATHLLHASSHHKRVLLTRTDLADYVARRPERRGIMVLRPLVPSTDGLRAANP